MKGGCPSPNDRILGVKFGELASNKIINVLDQKTGANNFSHLIGIKQSQIVFSPIEQLKIQTEFE